MTPEIVETNLSLALNHFVGTPQKHGAGRFLMEVDANERSLSHHLANSLQVYFPDWEVDCEYNRDGIDDPKELELPERTEPNSQDVHARTVFPDIIVHRRGQSDGQNNLLVIEIKKSSNKNANEFSYDQRKLQEYQRQLGYQYGFLVTLKTDNTLKAFWTSDRVYQNNETSC